jgi:hypothetical protein
MFIHDGGCFYLAGQHPTMAIHDGLRLGSFMDGHEGTGYCFMDSHDPLGLRARDWGKLALCILKQRQNQEN